MRSSRSGVTERLARPDTPEGRLTRDLDIFRSQLADAVPRTYTVSADGDDLSGEYHALQVLIPRRP